MERYEILVKKTLSAIDAQLRKMGTIIVSKKYSYISGKKPVEQSLEFGQDFAKLALKSKAKSIYFNRGKGKYHGNIKAFAEGLRKGGLEF